MDAPFLESEIAPVLPPSFQSTCNHKFYPTEQWNSPWIDAIPHENMNLIGSPQDIDPLLDDFNLDPLTCDDLMIPSINENVSQDGFPQHITTKYLDMTSHGRDNGGLLGDVCNVKPTPTSFQCEANAGRVKAAELHVGVAKKYKSNSIGYEEIAKYFYMNIADAAKELKVGLTVLKKRCRELGITRWPHRKMKSLQLLIRNVKEMGKGGMDGGLQKEIDELMEQRRQMELMPQLELSDRTKRLRQACFKANYKKRRASVASRSTDSISSRSFS